MNSNPSKGVTTFHAKGYQAIDTLSSFKKEIKRLICSDLRAEERKKFNND